MILESLPFIVLWLGYGLAAVVLWRGRLYPLETIGAIALGPVAYARAFFSNPKTPASVGAMLVLAVWVGMMVGAV